MEQVFSLVIISSLLEIIFPTSQLKMHTEFSLPGIIQLMKNWIRTQPLPISRVYPGCCANLWAFLTLPFLMTILIIFKRTLFPIFRFILLFIYLDLFYLDYFQDLEVSENQSKLGI